jgi:Family of unknown function (DUF6055)
MKRALPLALLLLTVAAPMASASGGSAKVRSVSAPRTATAGMPVDVTVRVAGRRRPRAAKITFYLSADARRDGSDIRLRAADGRPRIPESQAPGSYRLIACAAKSCRASGAVEVTKTPVGTAQLVDQAVAAGTLSPEQGLVYRAFAAFGDRRLPAAYAGDDAAHEDTVMREVAESWPKLSTAQRRQVEPFFTPPAAGGSWASGAAGASARKAPGATPTCATGRYARPGWQSVARRDGHVRIWWHQKDSARFARSARALLGEAEDTIWPKIWQPFGREPLEDAGERCFHGGDGKLDVYIRNRLDGDTKGETVPYPGGSCSHVPGYIVFNAGASLPTRWELAHEITHAIQFAFPLSSCGSFSHFDEAVATWGGQYVYPHDDREHEFTWFTKEPSTPLADATYDGWVFPYALEQLVGPGVMQRIYNQGATHQAMHAIDEGVPGGLAKAYPEFAKLGWNHDPVKPSFWEWDGFDPVPEDTGGEIVPEAVELGAAGQHEADLTLPQKPLSRAYKHLKFGPEVRNLTVVTPYDADLHVEALLKLRDGTTKTEDLAKRPRAVFCPESAGGRVAEMVLVASNTSTFRQMAQDKPIRVIANNLGCSRYVGTASGVEHLHSTNRNTTETWTVTGLVYQRTPTGDDSQNFGFKLVGGTVKWSYSGSFDGCAVSAGPVTLELPPGNSSGGNLQIEPWIAQNPARRYSISSPELPVVHGTSVCPHGTYAWDVRPHKVVDTWDSPIRFFDVPGNGVIDATHSTDEATGGYRDVTFHWHLEADG